MDALAVRWIKFVEKGVSSADDVWTSSACVRACVRNVAVVLKVVAGDTVVPFEGSGMWYKCSSRMGTSLANAIL